MDQDTIHGTAVSSQGRALLLTGPSGSGKSTLALSLMALGAELIADDRIRLEARDGALWAVPVRGPGLIEARGLGLLRAALGAAAPIVAELDLAQNETERLPPPRTIQRLGVTIPLFHKPESPALPAMLLQYLNHGLLDSDEPLVGHPFEAPAP